MNIGHRINARKVVLSYAYQYCFFCNLKKSTPIIKEALFFDGIFESHDDFVEKRDEFIKELSDIIKFDVDVELDYIIKNVFDKWNTKDIDMDYVFDIGRNLSTYKEDLVNLVNKYAKSFSYDQMDIIDQAIFLLGYTEFKELKTPKEVLLNEVIELSKRYADDGSTKLINGIMHNILSEGI